jgi:uncharacterized protein YlxW (UPF0749 family)
MTEEPGKDRPEEAGPDETRPSGPFEPVEPDPAARGTGAAAAEDPGAGRADPATSARRPTVEQPRPVDLYHQARGLRERLYGTGPGADPGDDRPVPGPGRRITDDPPEGEPPAAAVPAPRPRPPVPDLVPGRPLPAARPPAPADPAAPDENARRPAGAPGAPAAGSGRVTGAGPARGTGLPGRTGQGGDAPAEPLPETAGDVPPDPGGGPGDDTARETGPGPGTDTDPAGAPVSGRRRLVAAFWPPRFSRSQLVAGVLLFALGAGLAIQVRTTNESDPLRGARESDLVRVLQELNDRTRRLEDERHKLQTDRDQLRNSNDQAEAAREQSEARANALGILAGTVKATGPGITLTINDPDSKVRGDTLLDALQELRAAGAEVIQINQVRVVAGTWFAGAEGQIEVDGQRLTAPYVFKVIGNPQDLQPALNIPGGVIRTLEKLQAQAVVTPSQQVVVDALRAPDKPDYARSAPDGDRS